MRRRLTVIGLLAASVFLSKAVWAFECKSPTDRPNVSLRWQNRTLEWGIQAGSAEALDELVVNVAFESWSQPPCTDLQFQYVGIVSATDPVNQVSVVREGWVSERPREAVAVTETQFQPSTGWISRATIEVNEDLYRFGDAQLNCTEAIYDLQAVLTHEVGHFVGLGHTRDWTGGPTDPTMAPQVSACEFDKRTLEDDDRQGVCFLYPLRRPTGQCVVESFVRPPEVAGNSFGCRTGSQASGAGFEFLILLAGVVGLTRFRRRSGPNTCSRIRSAG